MGRDWCWMRPKSQNIAEVVKYIEEQALSYKQYDQTSSYDKMRQEAQRGFWYFDAGMPFYKHILNINKSKDDTWNAYLSSSGVLREILEIPALIAENIAYQVEPVSLATTWHIPKSWIVDIERTFLPEEIQELFNKYSSYVNSLKAGKYQDYRFHCYLYEASHEAYGVWQHLSQYWATVAQNSSNAWAQRMRDAGLVEKASALESPTTYSHVHWKNWEDNPSSIIDYEKDEQYIQLHHYMEELYALKREIHKARGKYTSTRDAAYPYKVERFNEAHLPLKPMTGF